MSETPQPESEVQDVMKALRGSEWFVFNPAGAEAALRAMDEETFATVSCWAHDAHLAASDTVSWSPSDPPVAIRPYIRPYEEEWRLRQARP